MSLSIDHLKVTRGRTTIIDALTLPPFERGTLTALIGPNGAGKSTLIHAISGLLPASGRVVLDGSDIAHQPAAQRARHVGLLPQSLPAASELSAYELLLGALTTLGLTSTDAEARIDSVLEQLDLAEFAFRPMGTLSGGQRQMIALAQLLARQSDVLLLDEPNSALDLYWQLKMMDAVRHDVRQRNSIALLALHDLNLALRCCDRIVVMERGQLAADGPAASVIAPELLARVYHVAGHVETCSSGRPLFVLDHLIPKEHA
ncbi:ABC transporter ATP-binding protein [Chitinibacteraceae bacterium HSL-7]